MDKLKKHKVWYVVVKLLAITASAAAVAFNINSFIDTGGLVSGGVTGITILLQRIFSSYIGIDVPYSVIFLPLNVVPIIVGFKFVGKKFTLYSLYFVIVNSIFTDLMPKVVITSDILLITIFGALLSGVATMFTLVFSASTGGFDFISIFLAERKGINGWNYVLAINAVILFFNGLLFGWDKALYSIIYQYVYTQVLNALDKRYQKDTLIIVTDQPESITSKIRTLTNHGSTIWQGKGEYAGDTRKIVYSVVGRDQARKVVHEIKKIDQDAFINVLQTDQLEGRFNKEKRE